MNEIVKELKNQKDKLQNAYIDTYTRIVGYYRPVRNWNKGKQAEYAERATFEKSIVAGKFTLDDTPTLEPTTTEVPSTQAVFLFWKNSCPNCIMPKAWAASNPGLVTVISVDENPEYIDKYNLMATPTLILDLGSKVTRICGVKEIMESLQSLKAV